VKQKISQWLVRLAGEAVSGPLNTKAAATAFIKQVSPNNRSQYQIVELVYQLEGFNYHTPKLD
jgi:hypothetical protein